jgi:UPF0271 protein
VRVVDLNCDCGEGFGPYAMGDDAAMLSLVTSANVACGFHAGDPVIMAATFAAAKERNVAVGAHPGFADLYGFGRRRIDHSASEIERLVAYQIGAAQAVAALAGHRVTHVKPHGALSNIAMRDAATAAAIARAIKIVDPSLIFLAVAGTELQRAGENLGLATVPEIYADRGYDEEGFLAPRAQPGAVIHEAALAARRTVSMVRDGAVMSLGGKRIPIAIGSVCVHGDTPGAVAMARAVRSALEEAGVTLRAFAPA